MSEVYNEQLSLSRAIHESQETIAEDDNIRQALAESEKEYNISRIVIERENNVIAKLRESERKIIELEHINKQLRCALFESEQRVFNAHKELDNILQEKVTKEKELSDALVESEQRAFNAHEALNNILQEKATKEKELSDALVKSKQRVFNAHEELDNFLQEKELDDVFFESEELVDALFESEQQTLKATTTLNNISRNHSEYVARISAFNVEEQETYENFYTTIFNTGGELGYNPPGYYNPDTKSTTYFSSQCMLISIMDHLLITGKITLDMTLDMFRNMHFNKSNWSPTENFNYVHDDLSVSVLSNMINNGIEPIQMRILRNICTYYSLKINIINKEEDRITWQSQNLLDIKDESNVTNVYILSTGAHFELLINGHATRLYKGYNIPIYMFKKRTSIKHPFIDELDIKQLDLHEYNHNLQNKLDSCNDRMKDIILHQIDLKTSELSIYL